MTNITVIKRSGSKELLTIEKWQTQIAKVCSGIADVSQSMIEIKSQPHFHDGITTKEIDEITLRAIVDLIDVENIPTLDIPTINMLPASNVLVCYVKMYTDHMSHHTYTKLLRQT